MPRAFSARKASKQPTSEVDSFTYSALKPVPALGQPAKCSSEGHSDAEQRQASYLGCKEVLGYNSNNTNLALFIKITNVHIPFSSYLEFYLIDTLMCNITFLL